MGPKSRTTSPTFFEKLFTSILCNPNYSSIVEWHPNGVLYIHNVEKFGKIILDEGVYRGAEGYGSIARQLRIYGFNRVLGKKFNLPEKYGEKVWKHEILTSACTLEEVMAYRRRAKPKKNRPRPSKKSSKAEAENEESACDDYEPEEEDYTTPPMPLPKLSGEDLEPELPEEYLSACGSTGYDPAVTGAASANHDGQQGGGLFSAQNITVEELASWAFASPDEEDHNSGSGSSFNETLEDMQAVHSGPVNLQALHEGIVGLSQTMFNFTTQTMFLQANELFP